MTKPSITYDIGLHEDLRDPVEAAEYLNAALEDGTQDVFLMALRDVAKAHGLTRLARETALNRENMYRILSEEGNPQLSSLKALLDSLELRLFIEPKRAVA
ncbi:MAG: putative addiction module antidote protein [Verrucomicrobia bacterium]|jgi:probable addiction module antidote protein|nr:putative addiction module antidote protein [Verrucomicrobiota bacterium]MBT7067849.1 putative addiction module antidote protein [Verrucomicrobiota bacterium]MBT7699544.1 putative addiction module antidote protein [Verrucomicrobiota bacterium]